MQILYKADVMTEWGSIIALSYRAAQRVFRDYNDMAEKMSPLGVATAMDCANYTVSLFSDLTKRDTLQNLYNDGGCSNMGVSDAVMDTFVDNQ